MIHDGLPLVGCTPEPLMNYLKTLGVFRLVAEQADSAARLSWQNGHAILHSRLGRDALVQFFLSQYRPTPIVGPWGARSGFYPGSSEKSARLALDRLVEAAETEPRLDSMRQTIRDVRIMLKRHGFEEKVRDADKLKLMRICRNELRDETVQWLDAVYVLTEDSRRFPPILGTGGNEGSGSYVSIFAQVACRLLVDHKDDDGIANALFGEFKSTLDGITVGHFNPGAIGGANSSQGFSGGGGVNPWDYLLTIEGCLLFAGSLARRQGPAVRSRAVFPFSVDSVAVGYGSGAASEETSDGSRAELWLPLWSRPSTLPEIRHLFAEGRAQLGKRQARNAVEFALAVNLLGINRGVDSFSRYGFLKRNGLAFLAAPLGRVPVQLRPQARLLDDPALADWVGRWRRATSDKSRTPNRYQAALRQIDRAMFEFATRSEQGNDARWLVDVLRALGNAERTLATGLSFARDKYIRPLQALSPDWLTQADEGGAKGTEFRLAAALAGVHGEKNSVGPLRTFVERVETRGTRVDWSPGSCSAVWTARPLDENLAAVFRRRQIEVYQSGSQVRGVPLNSPRFAPFDDVITFLRGETDDEKLADLLWGLTAINWPDRDAVQAQPKPAVESDGENAPFEFGIARLLVEPLPLVTRDGWWRLDRKTAGEVSTPDPAVFHELASGRPDAITHAVTRAARRHRSGGRLVVGYRNRQRCGHQLTVESQFSPQRLLAAMLFPLSYGDLARIANTVLSPPESED